MGLTWNVMAQQVISCLVAFATFVAPCLVVLLLVRLGPYSRKIASFVFRKMLHLVAFGCVTAVVLTAESWQAVAFTSVLIVAVAYPVLAALENRPWFAHLFVQKTPGEIKRSLVWLFSMFVALVGVAWGACGRRELAAAAILMWGTGDGMAALVGVPWGRHKVRIPLTDGKKSWEGSGAMFVTSATVGMGVLLWHGLPVPAVLTASLLGASVGTVVELITPSEYDTITVPAAILAVLLVCA